MTAKVALVYRPELDHYELSPGHPLKPARVSNSVALMREYGLLSDGMAQLVAAEPASERDVLLVHSPEYVEAVRSASADPAYFRPTMGLGTSDNPVFAGMHDVSLLICGGAIVGLERVLSGSSLRTFNIAGGLHHAHRARAAGFCVYNDPAVAIANALVAHPGVRVMYVDIDAHHGDGVEEAFREDARVLTLSIHESGRFLFPGTGSAEEVGKGTGEGASVNVPMPPFANDDCYQLVLEEIVAPVAESFGPDVIVLQAGADTHHEDPLTTLGLTLGGYLRLVAGIRDIAMEVCDGRIAACGGGGYAFHTVVPRAWTILLATLLDVELPEELPTSWHPDSKGAPDPFRPEFLTRDDQFELSATDAGRLLSATQDAIARVKAAHRPFHDFGA